MLPSSQNEKFKNGKKPKKKYQKFNIQQEKEKIGSLEKSENISVAWGGKKMGKTCNGFVDFNEFPELIISRAHFKNSHESSNSKLKENESQVAVINENIKKADKNFPVLSFSGNSDTNKLNLIKKEKHSSGGDSQNNNFAAVTANKEIKLGVEKKTNVNLSKNCRAETLNKNSVQPQKNFHKKKRADPVCINFLEILDVSKKKKKRKQQSKFKTKVQRFQFREHLSGNFLDSSNPTRSRGKHREIKKQKLTPFKTSIIKGRILKQKMREMVNGSQLESECFNLITMIDFKKEIKNYLDEFNKKKLENSVCNSYKIKGNIKLKSKIINGEKIGTNLIKREEENSMKVSNLKKREMPVITSDGEVQYSSRFREYCDNMITPDLNAAVTELISELIKYQDKLFFRDPIRAKAHKRHVSGIREVKKYLNLKKVKMVIIAPDLEKIQMEGGIYDAVNELKTLANSQNVPYGFSLSRYKLGICAKKNRAVSAFAVLNYEGLETSYKNALHELEKAKKNFAELTKVINITEEAEGTNSKIISTLISAFHENVQISSKADSD